jgi:hypothetical protein
MSLFLDVVCTDRQLSLPEVRQKKVRAIGEILPFVFAKYGIGQAACRAELPRKSPDRPVRFKF